LTLANFIQAGALLFCSSYLTTIAIFSSRKCQSSKRPSPGCKIPPINIANSEIAFIMRPMPFANSMKIAAERTGLSPHVLRIWEKRYQAVTPHRSNGKFRTYSEADIRKLELLARLAGAGHRIGTIAHLKLSELRAIEAALPGKAKEHLPTSADLSAIPAMVESAVRATAALKINTLEQIFDQAFVSLGYTGVLENMAPLFMQRLGDEWEKGTLSAAHEHAATSHLKVQLGRLSRPFAESADAPGMLVTTPAGQNHEIGAILAAAVARNQGWRVTYLGPSLPAEEIAQAAIQSQSRVVGLSIIYPSDDQQLPQTLLRLRYLLPSEITILAGGRAAHA
jgi:methylmalonyl-CoA mutase cobalamin-binding subunit/DNA-binding transcriptional MerR regulator